MIKDNRIYCDRCKKIIPQDMAYVIIRGNIILRTPKKNPMIFTCIEQAYNYAQELIVDDVCWIEMLKEHGIELYDMNKVAEKYKKEAQDGLGQN
jgi:hypothetical protein